MRADRAIRIAATSAGAIAAGAVLARPVEHRLSDLHVYLGAVSSPELYAFTRGDAPFTYPPFAAMLFRPLAGLPIAHVQVGWTLATLAVVAGIAALVRPGRAGLIALALVLSAPISSNLRFGQVSIFLAGMVMFDLLVLRRTRWAGILIGLAAAIKLTPLIFIPLLWFGGRRAAAVTATVTFLLCGRVAWSVMPAESERFWLTEIFNVGRLGHITSAGNQSVNGALLRLGIDDNTRPALALLIGGAIAAVALWRGARLARQGNWPAAAIVVGAASIVLSPVSWTHHQIWLVLAVLLPVEAPLWARATWRAVVLAIMLLPVTAIPLLAESRLALAVATAAVIPLWPTKRQTKKQTKPQNQPRPPLTCSEQSKGTRQALQLAPGAPSKAMLTPRLGST